MLHMSKLRVLRFGVGCGGRVLLTSAMRFSNFVSKFLIAAWTCESWIRLQTMVPPPVSGTWFSSAETKASFKKTSRTITTRNLYADCILKFQICLRWWNEVCGQASRRYVHFMTRHHRQNEKIFLNCFEIVWHTEWIIISIQENLLGQWIGKPQHSCPILHGYPASLKLKFTSVQFRFILFALFTDISTLNYSTRVERENNKRDYTSDLKK